jgi:hypothetical protein
MIIPTAVPDICLQAEFTSSVSNIFLKKRYILTAPLSFLLTNFKQIKNRNYNYSHLHKFILFGLFPLILEIRMTFTTPVAAHLADMNVLGWRTTDFNDPPAL